MHVRRWVSSVSIATTLGVGQSKSPVSIPEGTFLFYMTFRVTVGPTQPNVERGLGAVALKVKRQEPEADHVRLFLISMEKSPSREANNRLSRQDIPGLNENLGLIAAFTRPRNGTLF
jgi:hypothetical protein